VIVALGILALSMQDALDRFPRYTGMSEVTETNVVRYWHCATNETDRLEKSGESAETVVKAAFASCEMQRIAVESMMAIDASRAGNNLKIDIDGIIAKFHQTMMSSAILQVVEQRSAKSKSNAPN
jgi:hypothetical protein